MVTERAAGATVQYSPQPHRSRLEPLLRNAIRARNTHAATPGPIPKRPQPQVT